jgi:hypothetical protein
MKNFFKDSSWIVKVVAFATAFTVLYDFVKDIGEIAVHIYHFAVCTFGLFLFYSKRKNG